MFGSQIKTPKIKTATNSISLSRASKEQKTHSQKKGNNKDRKVQGLTELIEKQKQEIENLKAAQQLVNTISQAKSCLYVGTK